MGDGDNPDAFGQFNVDDGERESMEYVAAGAFDEFCPAMRRFQNVLNAKTQLVLKIHAQAGGFFL